MGTCSATASVSGSERSFTISFGQFGCAFPGQEGSTLGSSSTVYDETYDVVVAEDGSATAKKHPREDDTLEVLQFAGTSSKTSLVLRETDLSSGGDAMILRIDIQGGRPVVSRHMQVPGRSLGDQSSRTQVDDWIVPLHPM
jgi:hypothetical protein